MTFGFNVGVSLEVLLIPIIGTSYFNKKEKK